MQWVDLMVIAGTVAFPSDKCIIKGVLIRDRLVKAPSTSIKFENNDEPVYIPTAKVAGYILTGIILCFKQ